MSLCEHHSRLGHVCGIASFNPPNSSYSSVVEAISKIGVSLFFPEAPKVKVGRLTHFARVYREFEPEIVFGHSVLPALYGRLALPVLGPRPRFVSVLHSADEDDYADPRLRTIERLIGRRTDAVIALSLKAAEMHRERIRGSTPISIIPNGIELGLIYRALNDRTEHRKRLSLRPEDRLVLQVGRLSPVKQQLMSLRATLPLLQADASIHLWFAGLTEDKDYANELRIAIQETGLSERIVILGSRDDVPALLASADLYLMPSLQEAHSVAMLEALASGVPIVASNIPSFLFAAGLPCVTLISQADVDSLRASIAISIRQPRTTRDLRDYDIAVTAAGYLDCGQDLLRGVG